MSYCQPGHTLRELHNLSIQLLSEGLADLGVCGSLGPSAIARGAYSAFYPHSVGELERQLLLLGMHFPSAVLVALMRMVVHVQTLCMYVQDSVLDGRFAHMSRWKAVASVAGLGCCAALWFALECCVVYI